MHARPWKDAARWHKSGVKKIANLLLAPPSWKNKGGKVKTLFRNHLHALRPLSLSAFATSSFSAENFRLPANGNGTTIACS